jgi:hypothetical protein
MPLFEALVNGEGAGAIITGEQIAGLEGFFSRLSTFASPDLQQAIGDAIAALPPLASLVGMSMADARALVLDAPSFGPTTPPVVPRGVVIDNCPAVCLLTGCCAYTVADCS